MRGFALYLTLTSIWLLPFAVSIAVSANYLGEGYEGPWDGVIGSLNLGLLGLALLTPLVGVVHGLVSVSRRGRR